MSQPVLCVDVGSTFTKAVLVDIADGTLLATASHPTTLPQPGSHRGRGVLDGIDRVRELVASDAGLSETTMRAVELLVCSSAGGGLRLAVVGYEPQVSAEAARRVALSAGGKVVHVCGGRLDGDGLSALRAARPDVLLLVGGTDGGNAEVLLHNANRLARARWATPVVLAGNVEAAAEAEQVLQAAGRQVTVTANVLPRIGVLDAVPARAAIREAFLAHVIGGKHLARGRMDHGGGSSTFARLVRAATPDVVLAGVEVLADGCPGHGVGGAGDVMVVDIGGATTDVYSVVTPVGEDASLAKDVVAMLWRARTVEGDLGMRWGAPGVMAAAEVEGLGRSQPTTSLDGLGPACQADACGRRMAAGDGRGPAARRRARRGCRPRGGAQARAGRDCDRLAAAVARRRLGRRERGSAAARRQCSAESRSRAADDRPRWRLACAGAGSAGRRQQVRPVRGRVAGGPGAGGRRSVGNGLPDPRLLTVPRPAP